MSDWSTTPRRSFASPSADLEDGGAMKSAFMKDSAAAGSGLPRNARALALAAAALLVFLFVVPGVASFGVPTHLRADTFAESFRIAVIADLDQASKREGGKSWYSVYLTGTLRRKGEAYDMSWDAPVELATAHNEVRRLAAAARHARAQPALTIARNPHPTPPGGPRLRAV